MEILCYIDSGHSPSAPRSRERAAEKKSLLRDIAVSLPPFLAACRAASPAILRAVYASRRTLAVACAAAACVLAGWAAGYGLFLLRNMSAPPLSIAAANPRPSELEALDAVMARFTLPQEAEADENGALASPPENAVPYTQPVAFQQYTVRSGDTISSISRRFGLTNISTLISVNNIENVRLIHEGQTLAVPSIDGIFYTVVQGDTITGISAKHNVIVEDILDVNDLDTTAIAAGSRLFLPGARLDTEALRKRMGETFAFPLSVSWRLSSPFGARRDPFTGARSQHTGVDMAAAAGASIYAALGGRVEAASYSNVFGNYVIINHGNGYQTLYGHMQKILVQKGRTVAQGEKIGLVGSTGYATGPHLHFTVYKNGRLIDPMSVLRRR
jgi:murein DD-endopeptidase MepM/ murein hydrolase activator NlpD